MARRCIVKVLLCVVEGLQQTRNDSRWLESKVVQQRQPPSTSTRPKSSMGLLALASRIFVYVYYNSQNIMPHFFTRAVFGLLVPGFRTWQARTHLNSNQSDQQTLRQVNIYSEYWVVAGILFGTEMLVGWLIDWYAWPFLTHVNAPSQTTSLFARVPFYYELRALFVLWLLAPATQVSLRLFTLYMTK